MLLIYFGTRRLIASSASGSKVHRCKLRLCILFSRFFLHLCRKDFDHRRNVTYRIFEKCVDQIDLTNLTIFKICQKSFVILFASS